RECFGQIRTQKLRNSARRPTRCPALSSSRCCSSLLRGKRPESAFFWQRTGNEFFLRGYTKDFESSASAIPPRRRVGRSERIRTSWRSSNASDQIERLHAARRAKNFTQNNCVPQTRLRSEQRCEIGFCLSCFWDRRRGKSVSFSSSCDLRG